MKYAYSALAMLFLYLVLNSGTDPFSVKYHLNELTPGDALHASSGRKVNAAIIHDPLSIVNEKSEHRLNLLANIDMAVEYEKLCKLYTERCEQVRDWMLRSENH